MDKSIVKWKVWIYPSWLWSAPAYCSIALSRLEGQMQIAGVLVFALSQIAGVSIDSPPMQELISLSADNAVGLCIARYPEDKEVRRACMDVAGEGSWQLLQVMMRHEPGTPERNGAASCLKRASQGRWIDFAVAGRCAINMEKSLGAAGGE